MKRLWSRYLLVFGLAVLSGSLLLQVSQDVQEAEDNLRDLKRSVRSEQEAIRYLEAEWAYLNTPVRLERLALEYTDLVPPSDDERMLVRSELFIDQRAPSVAQDISYGSSGGQTLSPVFMKAPARKPAHRTKDFGNVLDGLKGGGE